MTNTTENSNELKESIPSPLNLREMLEEMAVKELLGPAVWREA
jgi:hypothetical protein